MAKPVIIIGGGGHARVIADILLCQGRPVLGFLDDSQLTLATQIPQLGRVLDAMKYASQAEFIIGIGANQTRQKFATSLAGAVQFTTAIHPSAVIANDVVISEGTVVMAGAVINTGSKIGRHCIINTSSSIDHDCRLADFVHVSPGAVLAGTVEVGEESWLGAGSVVINNCRVSSAVILGAGAVVTKNIDTPGTYVGIPARMIESSESKGISN